jgi:phosphoenolpyruvate carboxykinase (GTP)
MDHAAWKEEVKLHDELFEKLAYHLPQELVDTKKALAAKLAS